MWKLNLMSEYEDTMKTAQYPMETGEYLEIDYDENTPCRLCGLPVEDASTDGTNVCPWCAMGKNRDGTRQGPHEWAKMRERSGTCKPTPLDVKAVRAGKVPGIRIAGKKSAGYIDSAARKLIKEMVR